MKTLAFGVLVAVVVGCAKSPESVSVPIEQPSATNEKTKAPVEPPPAVEQKSKPATEQSPAAEEAKPAPEAAKDVPPALVEIFEKQNQLHKRQTGALLTITAKWEKSEKTEAAFVIDWSIDYNGPRRPFTILTPGNSIHAPGGRTTVKVWYLRPDGTPAAFEYGLGGGPAGVWPPKQKGWFSVSTNNKPVTGKIYHGQSYMKGHFGYLPNPGTPPLWAQMEHAPIDRGDTLEINEDQWTLDAWTGQLWSSVVEIAVK